MDVVAAVPWVAFGGLLVAAVLVALLAFVRVRPPFRYGAITRVSDREGADPAIVPLLEGLERQNEQLAATLHATRRLWYALGLVILGVLGSLALYAAQLAQTHHLADESAQFVVALQASRVGTLTQLCRDEKTLVSLVPPGYPPLRAVIAQNPESPLNPARRCVDFAHHVLGPRPEPPH